MHVDPSAGAGHLGSKWVKVDRVQGPYANSIPNLMEKVGLTQQLHATCKIIRRINSIKYVLITSELLRERSTEKSG
jgi:hypothetical protein